MFHAYQRFLIEIVDISRRAASWIVGGALCSFAILLVFISSNLTLDTDPLKLLDPNLPFRQLKSEYQQHFPQLTKLILVVIDSGNSEDIDAAADGLAEQLNNQSSLFVSVYQPGQDPFFKRQGLLYMKTEELLKLDERLAQWAPFLESVIKDPSLRGLFSVLGPALEKIRRLAEDPSLGDIFFIEESSRDNASHLENQNRFSQILDWIGGTIKAQLANQPNPPFWRNTMLEGLMAPGKTDRRYLLVKPRLNYSSLEAVASPLQTLVRLSKALKEQHRVRVRLTGDIVLQEEERQAVGKGAWLAAILSFVLVCAILLRGLGSLRLAGVIGVTLLIGLVWTAGFATMAIGTLNMISATAPVLFIGLGVDFGIQFVLRYREAREGGANHALALHQTASGVSGALTLAAIAAAVSFFSFLPTHYRGLAELGIISGVGMFLALLANLTLLPALLTVFPIQGFPLRRTPASRERLKHVIFSQRKTILLTALVLVGCAVAFLPQVSFDFNPLHLKDPSTEGVATFLELLHDPNTTPYTIQILEQNLDAARQLGVKLEALAEVEKTVTLSNFVPRQQEEKLAIIEEMNFSLEEVVSPTFPTEPPTQDDTLKAFQVFQGKMASNNKNLSSSLAANVKELSALLDQLQTTPGWPDVALEELRDRLLKTLPRTRDRLQHLLQASPVGLQDLPDSLKERYLSSDGRVRLEVFPSEDMSDNQSIKDFVLAVQPQAPHAIGPPVGLLGAGDAVVTSCIQATGLALLGVTLFLWLVLRRISDALLVLFPLILTLVLTLAVCVVVDLPLNLANVVALPLVLGLGIAFGIYLVLRTREGCRPIHLFQSSTFRAVWYSALTTIASFGTLSISDHRGMSSMGLLLTVSLFLTLFCSLVILPALIAALEARGLWSPTSAQNGESRGLQNQGGI